MKRRKIISLFITLILLSACDGKLFSNISTTPTPKSDIISQDSIIADAETIILRSGEFGDYYDTSKNMFLGYDGTEMIYYYCYKNNMVQKANLNSYEISDVIKVTPLAGNYVMAIIMELPWVIWSESQDKDLYVGRNVGLNWAIRAINVDTKEIVTIDSENEFFPKDRNFNPQPIEFSCMSNIFAFNGYSANEKRVSKAIKYFDFETRKLTTIAELEENCKGYSCPSVGDKYITFSESFFKDGELKNNILYLFDIRSTMLKIMDNPENLCSPILSENYIVAKQRSQNAKQDESIYIYDIDTNQWVDTINKNIPIYDLGMMSLSISNIEVFGDYLSWESSEDRILYLYNILEKKYYKLIDKGQKRYISYIAYPFKNSMFAWVDDTVDFSDPKYKYIIIK